MVTLGPDRTRRHTTSGRAQRTAGRHTKPPCQPLFYRREALLAYKDYDRPHDELLLRSIREEQSKHLFDLSWCLRYDSKLAGHSPTPSTTGDWRAVSRTHSSRRTHS